MVDVLLGLGLLFLILAAIARAPAAGGTPAPLTPLAPTTQLVLDLSGDGPLLNGQPVAEGDLDAELRSLAAGRRVKLIFIRPAHDPDPAVVTAMLDRMRRDGFTLTAVLPAAR